MGQCRNICLLNELLVAHYLWNRILMNSKTCTLSCEKPTFHSAVEECNNEGYFAFCAKFSYFSKGLGMLFPSHMFFPPENC